MKKILFAAIMFFGFGVAHAQLTANVGVTSDYRFRGISQTQNAMAFQGGIDYTAKNGFYIGNWNSSVSSDLYTNGAGVESDVYAGFKTEIVKGVTLDVGSMNYFYPRAHVGNRKFDTNELYVGVGIGPITAKYSHSIGDYFGIANSKESGYYQVGVNFPVNKQLTLDAHAGRTMVANNSAANYTDYKVGASYAVKKGWTLGAHYYTNTGYGAGWAAANTANGQRLFKDTVVLSASHSF